MKPFGGLMGPKRLSIELLQARTVFAGFTFQVVDDLNLISAETEQLITNSAQYALNRIFNHIAWQGTLDVEVRVRPAADNPFPGTNGLLPSVISTSWIDNDWSNDTLHELLTGIDRQPDSADAGMTIYLGDDGQIRNYGLPVWFDPNPVDYVPASVPTGTFDYIGVFFHEVFHGIGFLAASREFRNLTTTIEGNDYFIGSATQQVFGGNLPLAPRLGGSLQDHYGNTSLPSNTLTSGLMFQWGNYEGNRLDIGKLDLAVLEDLGLSIKSDAGLPLVDTIDSQVPRNILSQLSISENVPIGTTIGTLSTTAGSAGYTFAFADGGIDNGVFEIAGNALRTKAAIDFEAKSTYSILVRNTDARGVWTATPFTIEVIDVNESPYQNPNNKYDVTGEGNVTPLDALLIINQLGRTGATPIENLGSGAPPYLDVNTDFWVTPLDALLVINELNRMRSSVAGEGEAILERDRFFESLGANETQVAKKQSTFDSDNTLSDSYCYRDSAEGILLFGDFAEELIRRRTR